MLGRKRGDFANNCRDVLKKVWIRCIYGVQNFVVWKNCPRLFIQSISNPIVFRWTEAYLFILEIFCLQKISWLSDKLAFITPFWKTHEQKLAKTWSIRAEGQQVTRVGHWISCFKPCIVHNWWYLLASADAIFVQTVLFSWTIYLFFSCIFMLTVFRMGIFGGCSRMGAGAGGNDETWHSYTLPKVDPKNIWITWQNPWFLPISTLFYQKSVDFVISRNTDTDRVLIHNF